MLDGANKIVVTISWDDSHPANRRLAELLGRYNLRGTFYLDKRNTSAKEIKELSQLMEIGAHSLNHPDLTKLDLKEAEEEVVGSKKWLEEAIGRPVQMFAYPFGHYNAEIKGIVRQAGFIGARTTEEFCLKQPEDFFETGTALHIYPFPLRKRNDKDYHLSRFLFQPLAGKFLKILKLGLPWSSFLNWPELAKNTFDYVLKNGGVYHLWGHAFEMEKYGLWPDLENIFKYISGRENVSYLTNSQVLENEDIDSTR